MQPNLEPYSLASPTIALPVPRSTGGSLPKPRTILSLRRSQDLFRASQSISRTSPAELIAWLALVLSAVGLLGLSFAF